MFQYPLSFYSLFIFGVVLVGAKIDHSRWVDLTYPLSTETPVNTDFYTTLQIDAERSKGSSKWESPYYNGVYISFRYMEFYEHTGTHIDAPAHFSEKGKTEEKLNWEELSGKLRVINLEKKADSTSNIEDMAVTSRDLENDVAINGPIEPNSFVFIYTTWSRHYWTNATKFMYNPFCLTDDAVQWLIDNAPDMLGVGIDHLSPECPDNPEPALLHRTILPQGKIIIENVSPEVAKLPAVGCDLMIFPMHLKDGTGSPARLIAVLPGSAQMTKSTLGLMMSLMVVAVINQILHH